MHLELLVEDLSGKKMLESLLPRLVGPEDSFRIHSYKGIGHIPRNMRDTEDANKRILLDNLPKLLKGYGRTFSQFGPGYRAAVILVCDLDDRALESFLRELQEILDRCVPAPEARFTLAIEEGEAWLLGDLNAVKIAYPSAREDVLNSYVNDSICNTWETLANAVYQGGERALKAKGWQAVGVEKSRWAENISPRLDIEANQSPSFQYFRSTVMSLLQREAE
ncbi:MAG: hypothetical protein ACLGP3_02750 [Acidobacteriota bacterium]